MQPLLSFPGIHQDATGMVQAGSTLRRYAVHTLSQCGSCTLPASVQLHISKELCYVTMRMRLAHHQVVLPHTGVPPYDLEQLQAIESQLHQIPFSEQWQMPQPVGLSVYTSI